MHQVMLFLNQMVADKVKEIGKLKEDMRGLQEWKEANECPVCTIGCAIGKNCRNPGCRVRQCQDCLDRELESGKCSYCRSALMV